VATVNPLDHARQLLDLGKRAVSYYAYHRGDLTRERWNELLARKPEAS
jgi:hypothetical protein